MVRSEAGRKGSSVGADGGSPTATESAPTRDGDGVGALAPRRRWSASRKRDVVLRLLRGEPLDAVSREIGVDVYRLERWKTRALASPKLGLKERASAPLAAELEAAKRRIGERSMENELLRSRARAASAASLCRCGGRDDEPNNLRDHGAALRLSGCVARGSGRAQRSTPSGLACSVHERLTVHATRGPTAALSDAQLLPAIRRDLAYRTPLEPARSTTYATLPSTNLCPRNRVRYTTPY